MESGCILKRSEHQIWLGWLSVTKSVLQVYVALVGRPLSENNEEYEAIVDQEGCVICTWHARS